MQSAKIQLMNFLMATLSPKDWQKLLYLVTQEGRYYKRLKLPADFAFDGHSQVFTRVIMKRIEVCMDESESLISDRVHAIHANAAAGGQSGAR